jgi:hypothetical protein
VELTRWGTALNDGQWQQISDLYHQSMEDIFPRLEELYLAGDKDTFIGLLSRVQVSLLAHRGKLEEALFLKGGYLERGESMMKSFNNLEKRLEEINRLPDFLGLTYTFNIPQSGNYELTFQENKRSFAEMTAVLDGLNVDGQEMPLGGLRFYQQGQHQIALSFKEGENLLSVDRWSHGLDPFLEEAKGLVSFRFFPLPPGEASSVVHQEILGYVPEAYYQLSFDYLAKDKQAGVAVIQDTDVNKENSEVNPLVLRQLPGTAVGEFGHFRTVFRSAAGSSWANIYLLARQEQGELDSVKFKNVYLERVFGPKVVLRRQVLASLGVRNESPKIIFTRVNTTKYRVNVKGATAPYLLVFSESFHPGWKIYSKKEIEREKVTTSYFSGLINEGEHRNTFWAASTFETWKKRPIDEERHYQVNGYANAWQILPEDVEGRDDYELVVEFEPQKYFYIGIIVSLSVFGFCLTYLLVKRIWK